MVDRGKRRVASTSAFLSAIFYPSVFADLDMHEDDVSDEDSAGPLKWLLRKLMTLGSHSPRTMRLTVMHVCGLWLLHPNVALVYLPEIRALALHGADVVDEELDGEIGDGQVACSEYATLLQSADPELTEIFTNSEMYVRVTVAVMVHKMCCMEEKQELELRNEACEADVAAARQFGRKLLLDLLSSTLTDAALSKELYKKNSAVNNKLGVWFINSAQYRGWIFDDNLDIPRWVWVLRSAPTVKYDIYLPYDSRWRQMGAKRMVDRDVGFINKPMIDDASLLDDRQRLQTMAELHKVGQAAELAFLENRRAREESQKSEAEGSSEERGDDGVQGSKNGSRSKGTREEETKEDGEDRVNEGEGKGRESLASLERKISDRESVKGDSSYQGPKRAHSGKGTDEASTQGEQEHKEDMEEEGKGEQGSQGEEMEITASSDDTSASASTNHQTEHVPSAGRTSSTNSSPSGDTENTAEDSGGGEDEGAGKTSQDTNLDGDSDMGEEEWDEEEGEENPETLAQWIKHVHKLKWERHIECEIRLAHHKHLRNLKQATTAGDDITTANRFERLKNEMEVNEFYATQYGWKARLD
ncbi:hypothetical protein CBR_g21119 [Chara braunii]|uniref:Uncharacterized protein n=1 Tax=Chara braunii TaxID=69332 RepID=A0A388L0M3_CHABU|nr:hypothetical protein CBR_g21119 [Chara braunii]|eukprot:GBG75876.1 hypothetical protein CBR_g21119 [Chara braunii]